MQIGIYNVYIFYFEQMQGGGSRNGETPEVVPSHTK